MERLFSYKMTHDRGFAPCPFGGFLTLATCKPQIRLHKNIGDWIAGFTSIQLGKKYNGNIKMIYLMKIENKITFEEYWRNDIYNIKKPNLNSNILLEMVGDNIYRPLIDNPIIWKDFEQIKNLFHNDLENKRNDLNGKYVLLSNNFYYFGSKPLDIPINIMPDVPKYQSGHGMETKEEKKKILFLEYIMKNYRIGIYNSPHRWKENDLSWKYDEKYIEL